VEVITRACAQGTFFGFYKGDSDGGDRGTRPNLILYAFVLVGWRFDILVGDFFLYDYCMASCQSLLNN
jgi:hypothetical protein